MGRARSLPGEEILPVRSAEDVLEILKTMPEERITEISGRAREKVLAAHTAKHRAAELEQYVMECQAGKSGILRRRAGMAHV